MSNASVLYRRSAALFHYRGDVDALGRPITVAGRIGTFTRASTRWAVDSNGVLYQAAAGQLARHTLFDANGVVVSTGVISGPAQTNLVTNPDSLTTAAGWAVGGAVTPTAGVGPYAGRTGTLLVGTGVASVFRNVTYTSSTQKGFGTLFRYEGGTYSNVMIAGVYDLTAVAFRGSIRVTVSPGNAPAFALANGATNLSVQKLADDLYWVTATSTTATHTNTHRYYALEVNSALSANTVRAGCTTVDAPTIAMPYTQLSPDYLRFPVRFSPQALTALADFTSLGFESSADARVWQIGQSGNATTNPRLGLVQNNPVSPAFGFYRTDAGLISSVFAAPATPSYGQRVRGRLELLIASGTAQVRQSRAYGAGAESVGVISSTLAAGSTWAGTPSDTVLAIGSDTAGGNSGGILIHSLKIATNNRSLAEMEALF